MNTATVIAVVGLVFSSLIAISQLIKFVREHQTSKRESQATTIKATAERDAIAVKSAEGALLLMQHMLEQTKTSENDLRQRVMFLEQKMQEYLTRIRDLEEANRQLQAQLDMR